MYHPGVITLLLLSLLGLTGCSEPEKPTVNLYRAVEIGDLDQVKRHLHWDTEINQPDPDGNRPLHIAARAGRIAIARQLVEHGAEIEAIEASGRTALETALVHGRTQLAEMLIERGASFDAQRMLNALVQQGVSDRDSLEFLIERGADLEARDQSGLAPIHRAVEQGELELTTRLIRAGVDINALDAKSRAPLDIARANQDGDIAKILQQFGGRTASELKPTRPTTTAPAPNEDQQ